MFVADHVSFHVGAGMDGLVQASLIAALLPKKTSCRPSKEFASVAWYCMRTPVPKVKSQAIESGTVRTQTTGKTRHE